MIACKNSRPSSSSHLEWCCAKRSSGRGAKSQVRQVTGRFRVVTSYGLGFASPHFQRRTMKTYLSLNARCQPSFRKDVRIPCVIVLSRDVTNMNGNLTFTLDRKPSLIGCKRQKLPNYSRALLKISFSVVLNNGQVLKHFN